MMAGLWGLFFAILFAGFISKAQFQAQVLLPSRTEVTAKVEANSFTVYRNACVDYVINNPGFSGSIPISSMGLPSGVVPPSGIQNHVQSTGSGSLITVWGPLPPGTSFDVVRALDGDETVGIVQNGQWVSPVYGVLGVAPAGVSNGDILSQVQIGS